MFVSTLVKLITFILIILYESNGFNLSKKPSYVITNPKIKRFLRQVESSYFGFSLTLRRTSVIIGAPRAQSTQESQRKINETGAIYKCSFSGTCAPYIFDPTGNIYAEYNTYTYESEKKDYQWLGASIDGGPKDTDKLVVCAPRLIANLASDYLMHGVCYWTPDTLTDRPQNVKKIAPLRLQTNQVKERYGKRYFYHMFGEQGISVHVTNNNEEILIGAPGIHTWKGSVIRYHVKNDDDNMGMSRRDLDFHRVARQTEMQYTSDIPNPELWNQQSDSYFGYSVSSGYFDSAFPNKILYIATAPQANLQSGEAYIFDIIKTASGEYYSIKKYYTFHGTKFGEYFGYAVLAEDINGDGLTDVIITAPQYSSGIIVEQGAIYVYINKGRFLFELQKKIVSPINGKGRFGSTISKLGDINQDGFNDIAVGAPFAGNGSVFIYMGGSKGLREVHSQRLDSIPLQNSNTYGTHMFGHGLSKGSDIDNNGFNDFAVGAPNAEAVFVYRAYPVVKIIASINSLSREIKPDQTKFQIKICYMISTTSSKIQDQGLALRISVDPQINRVTLQQTGTNELIFNATALTHDQCRLLDANVRFSTADIFKPIELEMHYDLINGVPDSEEFCDKCAAIDPAESKVDTEKIIFSTGCKTDICIADLSVTSSGLTPTYTLGSSRTISVTYEVTNAGETAYLPQINITTSNKMPFAKIPSSCNKHEEILLCDLNLGQPMVRDQKDKITISYDVSQIEGTSMTLTAEVFSTGKEQTPFNNIVRDYISLREFTEIEAIGKPYTAPINLEKIFKTAEIINNYEVKSNGPSRIRELQIAFEIPIAHKFYGTSVPVPIVDINNITIQGVYNGQLLGVELYQNNTMLLTKTTETSTGKILVKDGTLTSYQSTQIKSVDLDKVGDEIYSAGMQRNRRNTEVVPNIQYVKNSQKKSYELLSEELMGSLPINRTIIFSCHDRETTTCARAVLKVYNFQPEMPVMITFKYNVDLNEVNKILIEPWEFFVIVTKLDIVNIGDVDGKSTHVTKKIDYNIISKHQLYSTPLWVIILAILGGLLVLAAIAYGMHKAGFFRRKEKEELDKLVQERRETEDTEDEG